MLWSGLYPSQKHQGVVKVMKESGSRWCVQKTKVTAEFLDLFFTFSFKKSTQGLIPDSQDLIRLSNNSVSHAMYKLWARQMIASGILPPDFSVKFFWLGWKSQHFSRKIIFLQVISWPFWCWLVFVLATKIRLSNFKCQVLLPCQQLSAYKEFSSKLKFTSTCQEFIFEISAKFLY